MININMRCIEIKNGTKNGLFASAININMRCIEIGLYEHALGSIPD